MLNIDRDKATRLGVNADMLDTMLNNSFSQRQVATIYKTLNQYHVIMGLNEAYTGDAEILKKLFVVNDNGETIPLSAFVTFSSANAALSVAHQRQSATSTVAFNLADGVSLEQAQTAIKDAMVKIALPSTIQAGFQGDRQSVRHAGRVHALVDPGDGDADLRSPLGMAIAGGLALSQLLTLFTTPVVYLYLDRLSRKSQHAWHRLRKTGTA